MVNETNANKYNLKTKTNQQLKPLDQQIGNTWN